MGTMPRLASVLLLGLGVAFAGCTTTSSNKDTNNKYNPRSTASSINDKSGKQADNTQFMTKDSAAPSNQPTTGVSAFGGGDPAAVGTRPVSQSSFGTDTRLLNNPPPPPSSPPLGTTSSFVPPPRPSGDAQLTNNPPADSTLRIGYETPATHPPDAVRTIPTTVDAASSTSQGMPLPPISTTAVSAPPLPAAPMQVPPPVSTASYNGSVTPYSGAGNLNPPALPPLPPAK